ncbi:ABC transporter permease [Marivirga sp. S37H4]|uniref:ABC transporter permease n=1 Tax=Marivirga aurantiaca TaxID=2802615 RepID=A0A934WZF6_9BACT|nr:ABC transporter permease [Marivirga aurantiaca]MBK6266039.1 ABC transporter permease [Marivirga aurantiaca]
MKERILANLNVAFEAVINNGMRSFLTALGIIFGVAAVISMLAIGSGAQQEILNQIKLVGVNNIVIEPIVEQTEEELASQSNLKKEKKKYSPGLTLADARSIAAIIPGIERVSPEIVLETYVIRNGIRRSAKLVGVDPSYFSLSAFELNEGKIFNEDQIIKGTRVCVIGKSVSAKFFPDANPVGKMIKVGPHWLKVIGVLKERLYTEQSLENLGLRDFNMDIYTPVQTVLVNYKNRAALTQAQLKKANTNNGNGDSDTQPKASVNYHQLDKLTVQVENSEQLTSAAEIISRMLKRRHYDVVDFEVTVPELLLKQQQKTKNIFNVVLGAIAGISLLVGGIGIMNIMLASVMERIKEIGLRLSLGAKKSDVVLQFLFEAVMISISGGVIGVILGIIFAYLVSSFAEIPTIVSGISIIISFGVAASVGLIFGIAPARKAANQDPITSLRHE